ncbi:cob(I)yrinic acid a,c-diamide adenosyltransferase [Pantoea stewartii]|uniref:cob(I)yrinic acid a,c-diamide adenosyltransferase n=1 Tax=Pantoea stewartii TaxID=66269 RepID=UPI00138FCE41|nr:cob(I)yrinic acid a,c-diamide adenosyltransferase [Pantoea stewartii]
MSDGDKAYCEEQCIAAIRGMKADVEVILTQLKNGHYACHEILANNLAHLIRMGTELKPLLSQPGVSDMLLRTDVYLMADLLALTHTAEVIENVLACLKQRPETDSVPPG